MTKPGGFTLIELVVGMALMIVIMMIIMSTYLGGLTNSTALDFSQQRDTSYIDTFNRLERFGRMATDFPNTQGAYTFTANKTIIIQLCATQPDGTQKLNAGVCYNDYVIYDLQGSDLHEIMVADPNSDRKSYDKIVQSTVTSVAFTRTFTAGQNSQIGVTVTINKNLNGRALNRTHTETIVSRNKAT